MYSINVFLTFSLSELGMSRFFIKNRKTEPHWKKHLPVHLTGLTVCLTVLIITTIEKFPAGGWLTLVITAVVIALCYLTRAHYNKVRGGVRELDELLQRSRPRARPTSTPPNPKEMTAIQLVNGYNGFGVHTFLTVIRSFPGLYKNFIFVSVAEVDVGSFKGSDAVSCLEDATATPSASTSTWPGGWVSRPISATTSERTSSNRRAPHRERGQGFPAIDGLRRPVRLPPDEHHPPAPP